MRARTATKFTATRVEPKEAAPPDVRFRPRRNNMRLLFALPVAGLLFAQEWVEFASREDRFTCNFPAPPEVTETTYLSQHEARLPARVYSASQGRSRYSVTVVDYNPVERILLERMKTCPVGAE